MKISSHVEYENKIPREVIVFVWKRDAGICQHPGCKRKGEEIHHTLFRSEGGTHDPKNLVLLCTEHHSVAHEQYEWRIYWIQWKPLQYVNTV